MKNLSLTFILLFLSVALFAQSTYSVKGVVADTASNAKLLNASVSVLNAKDSTLVTFTRAAENGTFQFNNLSKGKYILLVTYPQYADYVDDFKLDSAQQTKNFGGINMTLKSKLLAEVIIKGTAAAIKIKGDTTEYNAAAFKIQPDSKVEDLLKQLPGIQVDKDGKITAQGQKVGKVLLDGEEFFGDDPTLVTKNIRADMVDKVQLYDKKSDQATFTGIDDGEKTKTINIKLKEDKKKGSFGKVDAGVGTKEFNSSQVLFNTFTAKQKLSVYGTLANTGKTGLGWQDENKYGGGGDNMEFMDGGMMVFYGGGGDDINYNGDGIPLARTGGVHYDTKWNDGKQTINGNYKIGSLAIDGVRESINQNNQGAGLVQINTSKQDFHNFLFRQKLDGKYQVKLDSTSDIKFTFDGTLKDNQSANTSSGTNIRGNQTLQNQFTNESVNNGNTKSFNAHIFYTKRLKKKGRTLSLNISPSVNENTNRDSLKSTVEFYSLQGALDSTQRNDQLKTADFKNTSLNTNFTYTEPLSKTASVVFNYAMGLNNATADRRTFNRSAQNMYNSQVDSLSSDYRLNQFSNQLGAIFNYNKDKSIVNFGTKASAVNFTQDNLFTNTSFKRNFVNWFPQASFVYRFSQQKSFRFNYNGNTQQPSIDQIQPVRTTNDNINQSVGNPDLDPSFSNRFNIGYNSYKVLSDQYVGFWGSYSYTINPIVSNVFYDEKSGRNTYQSVNIRDKKPNNYNASAYFSKKLKKLDVNLNFDLNVNGNTFYNYSNARGLSELNKTNSYSYGASLGFSKYKTKKYDFYFSVSPNYNISESSLQPELNNNGKGLNSSGSFNIFLPWKFMLSSNYNYEFRAKTKTFDTDFHRFIWNATITKSFLKEDRLKLLASANDLLNKNVGFNRSAYLNNISQNSYTTIRRYFMFSLVYEFNKMGGGAPKAAN